LITCTDGKKVLLEYEGPYHYVKDQYYMTGEFDGKFVDLNKKIRSLS
jgi:hypothetical protein